CALPIFRVGAATVRAEDYRRPLGHRDLLTPSRRPAGGSRPALAVLTRSGQLPGTIEADRPTYLITPPGRADRVAARSGVPAEQVITAATAGEAVRALAARGHRGLQAEGGPATLGRLATAGLLDELCLSTSHRTVGGPGPRAMSGPRHDQQWQ